MNNYKGFFILSVTVIFISILSGFASGENESNSTSVILSADSYLYGNITIKEGWNFVSVPRRLADNANKADLFSGINSRGHSIWTFNQKDGGWNDISADDKILPMEGYWVYSDNDFSVPLKFSDDPLQVPPVKDLGAGWNMFGFTGNTPASARDSLLSIKSIWTEVIGWDEEKQQFDTTIMNGGSDSMADSRLLLPSHAYWLHVNESCSLASIGA